MSKNKIAKREEVIAREVTLSILEEVGVTPAEIVDLSVSEREKSLLMNQKNIDLEIEKIEEDKRKIQEKIEKLTITERKKVKVSATKKAKKALEKMRAIGFKGLSIECSSTVSTSSEPSVATMTFKQNYEKCRYSYSGISLCYEFPTNPKITQLNSELEKLDKAHSDARRRLLYVKKDLASISTHERMARGAIVRAKLMQSEKGKLIIKEMESIKGSLKTLSYSGD